MTPSSHSGTKFSYSKLTTLLQNDPWGCGFFVSMRNKGVKIISKSTARESYDLKNLVGGKPPEIDVIGVCAKNKS